MEFIENNKKEIDKKDYTTSYIFYIVMGILGSLSVVYYGLCYYKYGGLVFTNEDWLLFAIILLVVLMLSFISFRLYFIEMKYRKLQNSINIIINQNNSIANQQVLDGIESSKNHRNMQNLVIDIYNKTKEESC